MLERCVLNSRGWAGWLAGAILLGWVFGAQAADSIQGGQLYATHCAYCHGVGGASSMPGTPSFARQEDVLLPGAEEYAAGEKLMFLPDNELLLRIQLGKGAMPAFRGVISDLDILNIIAYLRTLQ